jgi:formate dehydrogenase major subunit
MSHDNPQKLSGGGLGIDLDPILDYAKSLRIVGAKETISHCRYCSVCCGLIAHTSNGKVINIEGDPENPISKGALCAKGAGLIQLLYNPLRVTKPKYRASGATEWQEVEWDWALDELVKRIKTTRDRTFKLTSKSKVAEKGPDGKDREVEKEFVVNRTDAILSNGSLSLNNEQTNVHVKFMNALGINYFDDKSRM